MGFLKRRTGLVVLIVSLVITVAAIWYLIFGTPQGGSYEGGTLVGGIKNLGMVCL